MIASRGDAAPLDYMGEGANVLWALQTSSETDEGYHSGADVCMQRPKPMNWQIGAHLVS